MWWMWPHLRRLWAGVGTLTAGLTVTYLYSLLSEQALPHLRFTEGFDTLDLKDAKALLDELGERPAIT